MRNRLQFALSPEQIERIDVWSKGLKFKIIDAQRHNGQLYPDGYPKLSYTFTPVGIGSVVIITEQTTGETLDVTDYNNW